MVTGDDGVSRMELFLLGAGISGSLQGLEALHALTKVLVSCFIKILHYFHFPISFVTALLGAADESAQRIVATGTRVRLNFIGVLTFFCSM